MRCSGFFYLYLYLYLYLSSRSTRLNVSNLTKADKG